MTDLKRQQLHPGQMMPDFELEYGEGKSVWISQFRNRKNLVVIFPDPSSPTVTDEYLTDLKNLEDEFQAENTHILIVMPNTMQGKNDPEFVTDRKNMAYPAVSAADYLRNPGSVVVIVDRFGEINAIFRQTTGEPLPPGDVLLEEVRFIELQCPE